MLSFGLRKKSRGDSEPEPENRPKKEVYRSLVACNECGFEFEMKLEQDSVRISEDKIGWCEVKYISCPECKKVGIVSIVDDRLYQLDSELAEAQKELRSLKLSECKDQAKIKAAQDEVLKRNRLAVERVTWLMDTYKDRIKLVDNEYGKYLQIVPEK